MHLAIVDPGDPRSLSVAFCERWGVAPEETLYVGDSEHDLATARASGCVFGLVEDAASPRPLTRAAADIVGATIGEIMLAGGVPPMRCLSQLGSRHQPAPRLEGYAGAPGVRPTPTRRA